MESTTIARKSSLLQVDDALYTTLYDDVFPIIASVVSRQGGTLADAEDLFQDAIVALLDMDQRVQIDDHRRYLVGIAKHLWLRRFKNRARFISLDDFERTLSIPIVESGEHGARTLLRLLQRTGAKCLDLLSDFYYAGCSIAEVALRNGFTSAHSASVQKHKCIEKLRTLVRDKSYRHEDFID